MKLLCVNCNQQMKLEETASPDESSMSIVFRCSNCGNRTSLITNQDETRLIKELDLQIGVRKNQFEPLEPVALQKDKGVNWSGDAEKRLANVPAMVRGMAKKAIERYAQDGGFETITTDVMDKAREKMGM